MDYTIITKHSETIKLLKVFQDKKSGRVIESRKILRDSFYFLRRIDNPDNEGFEHEKGNENPLGVERKND